MISTKGRYAVRVMVDLAEQGSGVCVPLKEIARRQEISKKYLEILVKELVHAGLLVGVSGRGGGYRLCRAPEACTVGEVLEVMEGTLAPVACLTEEAAPCSRADDCRTLPMWEEYARMEHDFFYGKTIADLARGG